MWIFPKVENLIGKVVIKILNFRQKNLTSLYNRQLAPTFLEGSRGNKGNVDHSLSILVLKRKSKDYVFLVFFFWRGSPLRLFLLRG